jgi:hypothetical protein
MLATLVLGCVSAAQLLTTCCNHCMQALRQAVSPGRPGLYQRRRGGWSEDCRFDWKRGRSASKPAGGAHCCAGSSVCGWLRA